MKKIKDPVGFVAKGLILAFALYFFVWGMLLSPLGIDKKMNHTIQAALYEGEEKLKDVTITVDGTYRNYFFQNDIFEGTFAVSCLPKTQEEYMVAHMVWREEPYKTYTWMHYQREFPNGSFQHSIDIGANTTSVLSRDMTELFWRIDNNRFISSEKENLIE